MSECEPDKRGRERFSPRLRVQQSFPPHLSPFQRRAYNQCCHLAASSYELGCNDLSRLETATQHGDGKTLLPPPQVRRVVCDGSDGGGGAASGGSARSSSRHSPDNGDKLVPSTLHLHDTERLKLLRPMLQHFNAISFQPDRKDDDAQVNDARVFL